MKLIVAVIRPEDLNPVQAVLKKLDVDLLTVTEVRGFCPEGGYTLIYRSTQLRVQLVPKLRLEIAVEDFFVDAVVSAITSAAGTGETGLPGDGKILVLEMDEYTSLRTRERRVTRPRGR